MRYRSYSDEDVLLFIKQCINEGIVPSLREIARKFNTSHSQIKRVLKRNDFLHYYDEKRKEYLNNQEDNQNIFIFDIPEKKSNNSIPQTILNIQKSPKIDREVNLNLNIKEEDITDLLKYEQKRRKNKNLFFKPVKRVGFVTDIHLGHHNEEALNLALSYLKAMNIDTLVIGGDVIDNESVSFWKNKGTLTLQEEIEMGRKFAKEIREFFGEDVDIYWIEGNHSVIESTEVLTKDGWKQAKDITYSDKIAMFDMKTGEIEFDYPVMLSSKYTDKIVKVKTNMGYEEVSEWHDLVVNGEKKPVMECMKEGLNQKDMRFAGYLSDKERKQVRLSDNWIRLITWLITDGTWVSYSKRKKRLQWKLSKPRKIEALTNLLDEMDIPYTIRPATMSKYNKLQPYLIRVYGHYARLLYRYLKGKKQFPENFKYLNRHQLEVLLETLAITDGFYTSKHISWASTDNHNIDIIQLACIYNNIPCKYVVKERRSGFNSDKIQYLVTIYPNGIQGKWADFEIERGWFKIVSITTKKGTLITRLNGKVNFTGNSNRLERYILSKAEKLLDLEELQLSNLLRLNDYNIKWIDTKEYLQKYGHPFHIGKLNFIHGHEIKVSYNVVNVARTLYLKAHDNLMFGHFHVSQEYIQKDIRGNVRGAWAVGCLCDLTPDYAPVNNWVNGFAYIEFDEDGNFIVYNKKIIDGMIL